jgi:hypothetical protein
MGKKITIEFNLRELNDLYYEVSNAVISCEEKGYHKVDSEEYFRKTHKNLSSLREKIGVALDSLALRH